MVSSRGKGGSLEMYCKEGVKLDIQSYSPNHIDAFVDGGREVGWWHLTGFYGDPDMKKRLESWARLKHLQGTSNLPWLMIVDSNEIMGMSEKEGGSTRHRP